MSKVYSNSEIDEAAKAIQRGDLVAFPTETVYGLGADATNPTAVKKVYVAKGRPSDNPLIVHVADQATVDKFAVVNKKAKVLMEKFWPGPLTIILPIKPEALDKSVTGGLKTAAFRNPDQPLTIELIQKSGVPLVGPSANISGKPSPTTPEHVIHDLNGKIAGVIDGGATRIGVESTVIDLSADAPAILRPGAITAQDLRDVIGEVQTDQHHVGQTETPKAPGMKYKHYAPNAQVYIVKPTEWDAVAEWISDHSEVKTAVMATEDILEKFASDDTKLESLGTNVSDAGHLLFSGLRAIDLDLTISVVFAEGFDKIGIGTAYMNRLEKSAGNTYFSQLE